MAAKVALSKNSKKKTARELCMPSLSIYRGRWSITLPKTDSQFAPDNGPGPKSKGSCLPTVHFQVAFAVCFRGVSISYSLWHSGSETSIAPSLSNLWNGKCYQNLLKHWCSTNHLPYWQKKLLFSPLICTMLLLTDIEPYKATMFYTLRWDACWIFNTNHTQPNPSQPHPTRLPRLPRDVECLTVPSKFRGDLGRQWRMIFFGQRGFPFRGKKKLEN